MTLYHNASSPDNDAWGPTGTAQIQIASSTATFPSPAPVASPILFLDDNDSSGTLTNNDTDGSGTFTDAGWTAGTSSLGYGHDYRYIEAPTNPNDPTLNDTATWALTVPADGWYSIQATWPTDTGGTLTNASYQVTATGQKRQFVAGLRSQ